MRKIRYQKITVRTMFRAAAAKAAAAGAKMGAAASAAAKTGPAFAAAKTATAAQAAAAAAKAAPAFAAAKTAAVAGATKAGAAAVPVAKRAVGLTATTVGFYTLWRGCEKAEEAVHERSGGRTDFFMTKAQRQQAGRIGASNTETPTPAPTPKSGQDAIIPSPLDDYFLNLPNSNNLTILFIFLVIFLFITAIFVSRKTTNEFFRTTTKGFLRGGLLAGLSWTATTVIFHYAKNFDAEDIIAMLQEENNISIIKLFVGILIGATLFLINKKFMNWYEKPHKQK